MDTRQSEVPAAALVDSDRDSRARWINDGGSLPDRTAVRDVCLVLRMRELES
jgi:hypothetical protein